MTAVCPGVLTDLSLPSCHTSSVLAGYWHFSRKVEVACVLSVTGSGLQADGRALQTAPP